MDSSTSSAVARHSHIVQNHPYETQAPRGHDRVQRIPDR
jgi:hypothetical protein